MQLAVRYLRVSTAAQQADTRYGLDRQRRAAERSEARHGLRVVAEIVDTITGVSESREGLDRLPTVASVHGASAVSLSEVDRLTRADFMTAYRLLHAIIATGLDVYAGDLKRRVNQRDPDSVREVNDRLKSAYDERLRTRERTYGGLVEKLLSGSPVRAVDAYGYRQGEVYPPEAAIVERAYTLSLSYGDMETAARLNAEGARTATGRPWTKAGVSRLLQRRLYKGVYEWGAQAVCDNLQCGEVRALNWRQARRRAATCTRCGSPMRVLRYEAPCPAIVPAELWEASQAARAERAQVAGKTTRDAAAYPLTGVITCGACGYAMTGHSSSVRGQRHTYYVCSKARRPRLYAEPCPHRRYYRTTALYDAVRDALAHLAEHPDVLASYLERDDDGERARQARAQAVRDDVAARLRRIEDGYLAGVLSPERAYAAKQEQLARLDALPPPVPQRPPPDASTFAAALAGALTAESLNETLRALGAKISVLDGEVTLFV